MGVVEPLVEGRLSHHCNRRVYICALYQGFYVSAKILAWGAYNVIPVCPCMHVFKDLLGWYRVKVTLIEVRGKHLSGARLYKHGGILI